MRVQDTHTLGVFVRARRKRLGLTQAELAAQVGVSRDWVVRLEQGSPRLEVSKVLDALVALKSAPVLGEEADEGEHSHAREPDPFDDVFGQL